ncbi:MAG TPA: MarR family transcriptional regulator [Candidatus Dormibacteraeota bacterium]|nr:MarR family transcriptional regulator [Candidatus Dormibacteraeota bacterium]
MEELKTQNDQKLQVGAWLNLQQANRVLDGILERRLREATEVSMPEYELLVRLRQAADHPLQMSEIAAQLLSSPSGTTRIADRLEEDGLIVRETPRDNRRVVRVTLTRRGEQTLTSADRVFRDALRESFAAHLSETDLNDLRRLMRKLLEGNGAWSETRCSPGLEPPAAS